MDETILIAPETGTSNPSSPSATTEIERFLAGDKTLPVEETPQQRWDRLVKAKEGRDAQGRFASTKLDEQPLPALTQVEDGEPDKKEKTPGEKLAPALSRLRAPAALAKLAESDPEIAKWILERHKASDEAARIAGELSKQKGNKQKPVDTTSEQATEHLERDGTLLDLTAEMAESLMLDEDGRRKLEAVVGPVMKEAAQAREEREHLVELVSYQFAHAARAQLQSELPELKDATNYARVRDEMQELSQLPRYQGIADPFERVVQCMKDAHAIRFSGQARKSLEAKVRSSGQPTLKEMRSNAKARFAGIPDHVARAQLLGEGNTPAQVRALLYESN